MSEMQGNLRCVGSGSSGLGGPRDEVAGKDRVTHFQMLVSDFIKIIPRREKPSRFLEFLGFAICVVIGLRGASGKSHLPPPFSA